MRISKALKGAWGIQYLFICLYVLLVLVFCKFTLSDIGYISHTVTENSRTFSESEFTQEVHCYTVNSDGEYVIHIDDEYLTLQDITTIGVNSIAQDEVYFDEPANTLIVGLGSTYWFKVLLSTRLVTTYLLSLGVVMFFRLIKPLGYVILSHKYALYTVLGVFAYVNIIIWFSVLALT